MRRANDAPMDGESPEALAPRDAERPRRVRRVAGWSVSALLLLLLMTPCLLWIAQPVRQSAVRAMVHGRLEAFRLAAEAIQHETGVAPTLDDVLNSPHFMGVALEQFSRATPIDTVDTGLPLVVQTVPCRAVRKGERWGGLEETIEHDLPACRYVLMPDWTVVQIDELDYERDIAPRIRLVPLP